ncbi:MAG: ribonuclease HII [Chloroflexi bacterium]|nr:ribonuclease HII [Chloroflexota bacterium]
MSRETLSTQHSALSTSLRLERSFWKSGLLRIVGVDEVGVGSLAGPVLAAAVLVPPRRQAIEGVQDSKVLSALQRERLAAEIRQRALGVGLGAASVAEVERLNVRKATHLAMRRALARVGPYDHALIDGLRITDVDLGPHTAIVDGDASCYAIACASIVAKVARDRLMRLLGARYPAYGWERNAGYGTPHHLQALRELGPTPFHRRTYAPVRAVLSKMI